MKRPFNFTFAAFVALTTLALAVFLSCGRNNHESADNEKYSQTKDKNSWVDAEISQVVQKEIPAEVMKRGQNVYETYCLACHQANGTGNPGMFPPLDKTKKVLGDKDELIGIILHGLSGKLEVKGETYYQAMAPHNFLSNQQIADVLTYIRNSFGNSASMITPEDVKKVRESDSQS